MTKDKGAEGDPSLKQLYEKEVKEVSSCIKGQEGKSSTGAKPPPPASAAKTSAKNEGCNGQGESSSKSKTTGLERVVSPCKLRQTELRASNKKKNSC